MGGAYHARMPLDRAMERLRERVREIDDLQAAASLMYWDQNTYLPRGGGVARGRHLATLERLSHERLVDPEVRRLLEGLSARADELAPLERDLVRVLGRDVERATRYPSSFMATVTEHAAASYDAWARAREANDYELVAPYLERTLELSRQYAGYFPEAAHLADPLIDAADEGMTVAELQPLFVRLRDALLPLVAATATAGPAAPMLPVEADGAAGGEARQLEVTLRLAQALGYDLERGRQDLAPHPFAIRMAHGDVRVTTRVDPNDLAEALFSTLHEVGHALYEQGLEPALEGTPLASGVSAGVHESQSRLWENLVGRSRGFWRYALPVVQASFPELAHLDPERAYRTVNQVRRTLIRTEADEVTYNLHVIVRFDLELALLEGRLSVADLPEAWCERYRSDLGVVPSGHVDGVLQDVHWFSGFVGGAFQGYTIGNVLSLQFFAAARAALGDLEAQFAAGSFEALHAWLREHVYQYGRRRPPTALVQEVTGQPLTAAPYLEYLREKHAGVAAAAAGSP